MRKSRFTEEQIRLAVEQAAAGLPVDELCRKYGVSQQTIYRWRSKYGSLSRTELQELRDLKKENDRLKRIVADLTLDKQILRDVLSKKD
jgi:putative transposase